MILKITKSSEELAELGRWHSWFAWLPIMLTDGSGRLVWLKKIERRRRRHDIFSVWWEFKLIGEDE